MNKAFAFTLGASVLLHWSVLQLGSFHLSKPEAHVQQGPNTLKVNIVHMPPKVDVKPQPIIEEVEEIMAVEQEVEPEVFVPEVIEPEVIEPEIVEPVVEEIIEPEPIIEEILEPIIEPIIEDVKELPKPEIISEESFGAVMEEAKPIDIVNPAPRYPRMARQRGWQGIVELQVLIGQQGEVKDVQVHQSSGYKILDKSAIKTIWTWQFEPAKRGTQAFESTIIVPVRFILTH